MNDSRSRLWNAALSVSLGVSVAIAIHFMLFRIGIPLKPFIYVVF
jgi:hypothetical protein